jgi:hypothetical protein
MNIDPDLLNDDHSSAKKRDAFEEWLYRRKRGYNYQRIRQVFYSRLCYPRH